MDKKMNMKQSMSSQMYLNWVTFHLKSFFNANLEFLRNFRYYFVFIIIKKYYYNFSWD